MRELVMSNILYSNLRQSDISSRLPVCHWQVLTTIDFPDGIKVILPLRIRLDMTAGVSSLYSP